MTITKDISGTKARLTVEGRLDTMTAPELEKEIQSLSAVNSLELDFSNLDYISSAGLRVLLSAHKSFANKEGMVILNANESVLDIFEVTGFKDILTIR